MFRNSVRPSEQGNCLEFDPNNQDLIILRSSRPIFEVSVDEEISKIHSQMENF